MNRIDLIINETIDRHINFINENVINDIRHLLQAHRDRREKSVEDIKKERKAKKEAEKEKKGSKRVRKLKGGGKAYYDYKDYERKNKKLNKGDSNTVSKAIDMEKTDIAAVARDIFPDHTDEGAQSQLRKILNHERPMTKRVARKLEKMISRGQIAVK